MTMAYTRAMDRVHTRRGVRTLVMVTTLAMLALLGPLGAGGSDRSRSPNDDDFLAALQSKGITYQSADGAIAAGHLVCSELDQGETPSQVAQDVINNSDLDAYHAGYFVGASVGAYCPYYSSAS